MKMQNQAQPSSPNGTRLPWLIWGVSFLSTLIGLALLAASFTVDVGIRWGPRGFSALFAITYSTVGALIVARHSRHLIGWLFLWTGFASTLQVFAEEYAIYALLANPVALPSGEWLAWLQNWIWPLAIAPVAVLPLLFPSGHLLSRRWTPVVIGNILALTAIALGFAIQPGPLGSAGFVVNPLATQGLGDVREVM